MRTRRSASRPGFYDKFADWTYSGGDPERGLTRDEMLDDISLYWLTNTAISSARLYWENNANNFKPSDISIPVAITVFPGEIYQAPRSWAERAYHNLIYYNGSTRAATSQPGSSRSSSPANSAPPSNRFEPQADLQCSKQWRQCGKLGDRGMSSTQARSATATRDPEGAGRST